MCARRGQLARSSDCGSPSSSLWAVQTPLLPVGARLLLARGTACSGEPQRAQHASGHAAAARFILQARYGPQTAVLLHPQTHLRASEAWLAPLRWRS